MIDQRPRERDALRHAAGKMMRISVGEIFQPHQPHEFIHFMPLLREAPRARPAPPAILRRTVSHGKRFGS